MTETSPIVTMTPMNKDKERNGSCGVLVPNTEVKIVDINTGGNLVNAHGTTLVVNQFLCIR